MKTKYIGDFLGYTLLKNMDIHRTSGLVGFRSTGKFWQFEREGKNGKDMGNLANIGSRR